MALRGAKAAPRGAGPAYSLEEGTLAVRAARAYVEAAVGNAKSAPKAQLPERFKEPSGVFTTLSKFPSGELRGCVGFAEPVMPLGEALKAASVAAALEDGRFEPVAAAELPTITVEVSLLTPPVVLDAAAPEEKVAAVEVGRHGLIIRSGRRGGLLLPQVATDWKWGSEEFLTQTCRKGGFELDFWKSADARILTFEAEVFGETSPKGAIVRHAAFDAH